jgi:hypothetical protein
MPIKRSSIPKLHLEVPTTMGAFMGIERRNFLTASASVILTVTTIGGNRRSDQLAAGRDWLRTHLKAIGLGVSFEPQSPALNDYPEMRALLTSVHETLSIPNGQRVQMLARLGYVPQGVEAARWPIETRILPT